MHAQCAGSLARLRSHLLAASPPLPPGRYIRVTARPPARPVPRGAVRSLPLPRLPPPPARAAPALSPSAPSPAGARPRCCCPCLRPSGGRRRLRLPLPSASPSAGRLGECQRRGGRGAGRGASLHSPRSPQPWRREPPPPSPVPAGARPAPEGTGLPPPAAPAPICCSPRAKPPFSPPQLLCPPRPAAASPPQRRPRSARGAEGGCPPGPAASGPGGKGVAAASLAWGKTTLIAGDLPCAEHPPLGSLRSPAGPLPLTPPGRGSAGLWRWSEERVLSPPTPAACSRPPVGQPCAPGPGGVRAALREGEERSDSVNG